MSLISIHNFAAPFTSKTHLITIVLVAMLFAAFRLSGGAVTSKTSQGQGGDLHLADPEIVAPEAELAESEPTSAEPSTDANLLDQMIGKKGRDAQKGDANGSSLDDIERRLGLR